MKFGGNMCSRAYNVLERKIRFMLFKLFPRYSLAGIRFYYNLIMMRLGAKLGKNVPERIVEYPWVLKNLKLKMGRILDVGCCDSLLSCKLASDGYDVYGIDVRPYSENHPNLKFYQMDVRRTPFQDDFFDRIIAISTIEHIELGSYGNAHSEIGDIEAMRELKRILRKDGKMLVTLPYAKTYSITSHQRVYDIRRLRELVRGLTIEREDYFVRGAMGWLRHLKRS